METGRIIGHLARVVAPKLSVASACQRRVGFVAELAWLTQELLVGALRSITRAMRSRVEAKVGADAAVPCAAGSVRMAVVLRDEQRGSQRRRLGPPAGHRAFRPLPGRAPARPGWNGTGLSRRARADAEGRRAQGPKSRDDPDRRSRRSPRARSLPRASDSL